MDSQSWLIVNTGAQFLYMQLFPTEQPAGQSCAPSLISAMLREER